MTLRRRWKSDGAPTTAAVQFLPPKKYIAVRWLSLTVTAGSKKEGGKYPMHIHINQNRIRVPLSGPFYFPLSWSWWWNMELLCSKIKPSGVAEPECSYNATTLYLQRYENHSLQKFCPAFWMDVAGSCAMWNLKLKIKTTKVWFKRVDLRWCVGTEETKEDKVILTTGCKDEVTWQRVKQKCPLWSSTFTGNDTPRPPELFWPVTRHIWCHLSISCWNRDMDKRWCMNL